MVKHEKRKTSKKAVNYCVSFPWADWGKKGRIDCEEIIMDRTGKKYVLEFLINDKYSMDVPGIDTYESNQDIFDFNRDGREK